jgi:hypothetical protein
MLCCFEVDTGVVAHLAFVLGKQPQTCEPFVKPVTVASNLVSELREVGLKVLHSFFFQENLLERNCEMTFLILMQV